MPDRQIVDRNDGSRINEEYPVGSDALDGVGLYDDLDAADADQRQILVDEDALFRMGVVRPAVDLDHIAVHRGDVVDGGLNGGESRRHRRH